MRRVRTAKAKTFNEIKVSWQRMVYTSSGDDAPCVCGSLNSATVFVITSLETTAPAIYQSPLRVWLR